MSKSRERGEKDFWKGKNLNDNPYPRNSEESREWDRGNWDAYDDYKREREEREK
jgi:hypothetical protein